MSCVGLFVFKGTSEERAASRGAGLREIATAMLAATPLAASVRILVGIDEPRELNLYREGDDYAPPYDIAVIADAADGAAFMQAASTSGLAGRSERWLAFEVETTPKLPRAEPAVEGEVAGIHMLHPLLFHHDLPMSAILRSWKEVHGDLALKIHVGANLYNQHLITSELTGNPPGYGGFSEFHFPSHEALVGGYFESDRGRQEIRHDIRHFIRGIPPRLFAREHRYTSA